MVIVKIIGGLGNQLFQYALGHRIAEMHQVPLKVDISEFESYTLRTYKLCQYNIVAEPASHTEIEQLKGLRRRGFWARISRRSQNSRPYYKQSFIKERQWFEFDANIFNAPKNVYLEGYWQNEKYFKDIELILRHEFTLKHSLEGKNAEIAGKILACNSVSLHVRRGDYINNPIVHQAVGGCSLEYYFSAVKKMCSSVDDPQFFIFSDDLLWAKENLKLINRITFIDHNGEEFDYEDLRLMSLCRHHIIANSSFSWWGAWLNTNPNKIVIAPRLWFNNPSIGSRDLIPDGWIVV